MKIGIYLKKYPDTIIFTIITLLVVYKKSLFANFLKQKDLIFSKKYVIISMGAVLSIYYSPN